MIAWLAAWLLLLVSAAPAFAQQPAHILGGNGEKAIATWASESSADAGARLLNA